MPACRRHLLDERGTDRDGYQPAAVSRDGAPAGGGSGGSLAWLGDLDILHRVYVHINNTTPMLNEESDAWQKVHSRGIRIAADGDEFVL